MSSYVRIIAVEPGRAPREEYQLRQNPSVASQSSSRATTSNQNAYPRSPTTAATTSRRIITVEPDRAPPASTGAIYTIGVEIEACLLKDGKYTRFFRVSEESSSTMKLEVLDSTINLARIFNMSALSVPCIGAKRMLVQGDPELKRDKYKHWALTFDGSIKVPTSRSAGYGVEIVSPVLRFNTTKTWIHDINHVFRIIKQSYKFSSPTTCGTHVHIQPKHGWNVNNLKCLCRAIIFFESV